MLKAFVFGCGFLLLAACSGNSSDGSAFKDYDLKSPCAGAEGSPCGTRIAPNGNKQYL